MERIVYPVFVRFKSFEDLLESSPTHSLFHTLKGNKHVYYFYGSVGENVVLILGFITKKKFKRYVGIKNSKILESDLPNCDSPIPIVEIEEDPIIEGVSIYEEKVS